MSVSLNDKYLKDFIDQKEIDNIKQKVQDAHQKIADKSGKGSDFLGWVDLPLNFNKEEFERIKKSAKKIREQSQVLIVIGIGGSYLGARSAIEFLKSSFYNSYEDNIKIFFVGNNLSPSYFNEIISFCENRDFSVNVVSKSGTTTEPAIAFRIFRDLLIKKYGEAEAKERIYATTDKARGALKQLCDKEGYETFVIADDIGGRYSVLSAVGLLPIAVCGADIDKIMKGAALAHKKYGTQVFDNNDCYKYAAYRNILYNSGKTTEILACYEPDMLLFAEWYKQLFGESEGKENKGIYPSSLIFTTDLHSMGQYVQQGLRNIFETVLLFETPKSNIKIPDDSQNSDGLSFLSGKDLDYVNKCAFKGTLLAHLDGGVPNIVINVDKMDEENYGELVYFFEKACAISGYILDVNPFNQPGVEDYKNNMYALLGKPGFETAGKELMNRLLK